MDFSPVLNSDFPQQINEAPQLLSNILWPTVRNLRAPAVCALKVAAHNFVESTVAEHEGLELEAARAQQVDRLLVLVRKPAHKRMYSTKKQSPSF